MGGKFGFLGVLKKILNLLHVLGGEKKGFLKKKNGKALENENKRGKINSPSGNYFFF